ncbi:hypothetical protein L1887_19694 [Cichorium endivia]|nr:hypothetical protein L1887_19694 [Cichorium endivia]
MSTATCSNDNGIALPWTCKGCRFVFQSSTASPLFCANVLPPPLPFPRRVPPSLLSSIGSFYSAFTAPTNDEAEFGSIYVVVSILLHLKRLVMTTLLVLIIIFTGKCALSFNRRTSFRGCNVVYRRNRSVALSDFSSSVSSRVSAFGQPSVYIKFVVNLSCLGVKFSNDLKEL